MAINVLFFALACQRPGVASSVDSPGFDGAVADSADTGDSALLETGDSGLDTDTGETGSVPVDADRDGYDESVDCDDAESAIHPGATDWCDGIDQDCDGDPVGAGMCGEGLGEPAVSDATWFGYGGESFGAMPTSIDGEPAFIVWLTGVHHGGWDIGGSSSAVLAGIPAASTDWLDNLVQGWHGEWEAERIEDTTLAGDFDGDGHDDMWLPGRMTSDYDYDSVHLVTGPFDSMGGGFIDVNEVQSAQWFGVEPDDLIGAFVAGQQDVDGDGLADGLVLSAPGGGSATDVLALLRGRTALESGGISVEGEPWALVDQSTSTLTTLPNADGTDTIVLIESSLALLLDVTDLETAHGSSVEGAATLLMEHDIVGGHFDYNGPTSSVGDLNGDGLGEVSWAATDGRLVTLEGSCQLWFPGGMTPTADGYQIGDLTRACLNFEGNISTFVVGDLDDDGILDVNVSYRDDANEYHRCFVPSTRLVFGSRVDVTEVGLCSDWARLTIDDLDSDGFPEFVGEIDGTSSGRTDILFGFAIPWEDASKW